MRSSRQGEGQKAIVVDGTSPFPALPFKVTAMTLNYVLPLSFSEPMNAMDHTGEKHPTKPQLGEELRVTSVTQNSVDLSWTVSEGQFDSFVVQYKDRDGQYQVVPVDGSHREVRVSGLDPGRRYKLLLYGLRDSKRVGPLSVIAVTGECDRPPNRPTPFRGGFIKA